MTTTSHPPSRCSRLAPGALLLALSACAPPSLYYDTAYTRRQPTKEEMRPHLVRAIANELEGGAVKELVLEAPEGRFVLHPKRAASVNAPDLGELPLPALEVIWELLDTGRRGAERDVVIPSERYGLLAISTYRDLEDRARVVLGRTLPPPVPVSLSREELAARHGIGQLEEADGRWNNLDLYYLDHALSLVAPDERFVIQGVPFVRYRARQGSSRDYAAFYVAKDHKVHIEVYDNLRGSAIFAFCGEPSAPQPMGALGLMHEVGHAVAHHAEVELLRRANEALRLYNEKVMRYNGSSDAALRGELAAQLPDEERRVKELQAAFFAEQRERKVLSAYRAARGPTPGPTPYGRTDDDESFAESFALYHLDPAALLRVYPAVHAFFERREHIQALLVALTTGQ